MHLQRLDAVKIRLHPSPPTMAKEGTAVGGVIDINTALQEVMKTALSHDGLASDKRPAHLRVLAPSCGEPL